MLSALQELSSGRMFLALGVGDFALTQIGEKPWTLADTVTYGLAVRSLTRGDEVDWNGQSLIMRWPVQAAPFWLAAEGPRALRLAGQHADGVVVGNAAHPDMVRWSLDRLREGAAKVNRSPDELEPWLVVRTLITDEARSAVDDTRVAAYSCRLASHLWRSAGRPTAEELPQRLRERRGIEISEDVAERFTAWINEYSAWNAYDEHSTYNVELLDRYGLRQWVGDLFYISGSKEHVVQRLRELVDAGARNIIVPVIADDRRAVAEQIADAFNELSS
jgi:5,10-methylenetetrahydromethanopterin reductase